MSVDEVEEIAVAAAVGAMLPAVTAMGHFCSDLAGVQGRDEKELLLVPMVE